MTLVLLASLLVKSSLIAGAGLAASRFLTSRAVERVDILRATVCLLLALPAITNALPPIELALLPPLQAAPLPPVAAPDGDLAEAGASASPWASPGAAAGGLWLLGAALIGGRLALGLRTLHRWTREAAPVTAPEWRAPIEDLPPADQPYLASSDRVAGPLSWGVAPGVIVIDPATLAQPHAARAIMAHELAHLRRHDWIFLILSRLSLAIFWFNPLVWRLHAALTERSEEAADAAAVAGVDRAVYARTLVRLAAHPAPFGATAMAADSRTLKTRIARIMTDTAERRRPLTVVLTVAALTAVAAPLAAFALGRQATSPPPVPPAPPAAVAPPVPPAQPADVAPPPAPPVPPEPPKPTRHAGFLSEADIATLAEAHIHAEQARHHAELVRVSAEEARHAAEEARRHVEAHRGEIEAAAREAAREARLAAERVRLSAEDARRIGEEARRAGERARVLAMKEASAGMAEGAVQMRAGARQMREEAARLRDPAYRAKQIEENRARGHEVTDGELLDLSRRLPGEADRMERQADRMAQQARDLS